MKETEYLSEVFHENICSKLKIILQKTGTE